MPEHNLSPHLHEKYTKDLLATMRRIDNLEAEKKECTSFIGDVIKTEKSRETVLRDLLEGRVSEQVALPGLEAPEAREREIGARLRLAVDKVELLCHVDAEVRDLGAAVDRVRNSTADIEKAHPGAKACLRFVDPDKLVGTREEAVARHEVKRSRSPKPKEKMIPVLAWRREGENLTASTPDGTYCIEPRRAGGFTVLWTPPGGKSKQADTAATQAAAKDLARKHQLDAQADALLRNAGAGELTKADTKGPAVARRNGGRRA